MIIQYDIDNSVCCRTISSVCGFPLSTVEHGWNHAVHRLENYAVLGSALLGAVAYVSWLQDCNPVAIACWHNLT